MLPELAPDAAAACFAAGALDVWTAPVQMKRGRPGFVMSALARPESERAVAEAMLRETSTLGVRIAHLDRIELERESWTVEVGGEPVRVKVGRLDGHVVNLAPEHADCERAARISGEPVKVVWARALAAAHEVRGVTRLAALSRRASPRSAARSSRSPAASTRPSSPRSRTARSATARSPSPPSPPPSPQGELDGARRVAQAIGIAHETVSTDELARAGYRANGRDRCYFCKTELYDVLAELATARGYATLLSGANADDAGDWRPGLRAAAEHGVIHPLHDVTKDEVRVLARQLGAPQRREARDALPRLPDPVRHGRRSRDAEPDRPRRARRPSARLPRAARAPPRDHGPPRSRRPTTSTARCRTSPPSPPRSSAPATATR